MTPQEIKEILRLHKLWLSGDSIGLCADFSGKDLRNMNFSTCNFSKAIFSNANLRDADFRGAILIDTNFNKANLNDTDFCNANLTNANFLEADLRNIDLDGAILKGTLLENKVLMKFQFSKHTAYYFGEEEVQIGCHKYSIEYWLNNYKEIGKTNSYNELEEEKYLKFVKNCIAIIKGIK